MTFIALPLLPLVSQRNDFSKTETNFFLHPPKAWLWLYITITRNGWESEIILSIRKKQKNPHPPTQLNQTSPYITSHPSILFGESGTKYIKESICLASYKTEKMTTNSKIFTTEGK